ncbi:helix-turn-helix domain containing protein [Bacillus cereus]|uniref:helix-turn-helix domain-containing protein n=1 Tax=Bacillus cereus TaxID=1396 RepID=UPI001C8DA11B|nr:helix-turn-helix domain containing protein [Bacillus cereus]MBY0015087.1 helix-turn-helix domain containing protein [Bacillus cereus]
MNQFTYNLIHDKFIIRKMIILNILDNGRKFVSSNYLAEQLGCTVRTISTDISQLKEELPQNWEIHGLTNKGYILIKPLTNSLSTLVDSYLSSSTICKIMLKIFKNEFYTMEKWSQSLYINKSTLLNNLKEYNNILDNNKLSWNFRELQLTGDELNIRYYYCVFFYFIHKYKDRQILPDELGKRIKLLLNKSNFSIDFEVLSCIIYVSIHRWLNKYTYEKVFYNAFQFNNSHMNFFNKLIEIIEDYYKIKISQIECDALKLFLFFEMQNKSDHGMLYLKYLYELDKELYYSYLELIDIFKSRMSIGKKEELCMRLIPYFFKANFYNQYNLAINYVLEPLDMYKSVLLKGYNQNYNLVSRWNKKFNNTRFNSDEIKFISTYITIILNSYIKKKVLLLYRGTDAAKEVIYSKLKKCLGEYVSIHSESRNNAKFDFIITNFQQENTNSITFFISDSLCDNTIKIIKENILDIK